MINCQNCTCKKKEKKQLKKDYKFLKGLAEESRGVFSNHSFSPYHFTVMETLLRNMGLHLKDNGRFLYARKEVKTKKSIYALYVSTKFITADSYKIFFNLTKMPNYHE